MRKIKVAAVSYLNTKPFLYGLFQSPVLEHLELELAMPSRCADLLLDGSVDLALVPVAALTRMEKAYLVSDLCIGAEGSVRTVCIFGQCPLHEMSHLYLDYQSRTSVELAKILLREHWQHEPILLPAEPGFENKIEFTRGAVVIGDRTVALERRCAYAYDLAEAWMQHTGLPFVFAAWISRQPLDAAFVQAFNEALLRGVEAVPQLLYLIPPPTPDFDLQEYYTRHISYALDASKQKALALFLEKIQPGSSARIVRLSGSAPLISI